MDLHLHWILDLRTTEPIIFMGFMTEPQQKISWNQYVVERKLFSMETGS